MTIRRHTHWGLACGLAAVAIVGCADGSSGPTEVQQPAFGTAQREAVTAVDPTLGAGAISRTTFTLQANKGGDYRIGGEHWIHFPRQAVCDPATSTYGPTEWDAPCTTLTGPIAITALSWRDTDGHPRIEFEPALRFVPSTNPNHWVTLTFVDPAAAHQEVATILWCAPDGTCVDEAGDDATLVTRRSEKLGTVSRRIKHFSGYVVTAGRFAAFH